MYKFFSFDLVAIEFIIVYHVYCGIWGEISDVYKTKNVY